MARDRCRTRRLVVVPAVRLFSLASLLLAACDGEFASEAVATASLASDAAPPRLPPSLGTIERIAEGARFDLPNAVLFVPAGYRAPDGGEAIPLFVHFQGGATIAEENFARMRRAGVLIASRLSGLSSRFSEPYRDPSAFREMLAATEQRLTEHFGRPVATGPITITFFSAGYGAVREILKDPRMFARVVALISADSIYADVAADGVRAPRVEQMVDFARFAQAAARGEKTFVVAHGKEPTPYASTAETADFLLAALDLERVRVRGFTRRGVPIESRAHAGGFWLYTFDEAGPTIHMDLLYAIPELARAHLPAGGGSTADGSSGAGGDMLCEPLGR